MKQKNLKEILNMAKGIIKYNLIISECGMENMNVYEIAKLIKHKFIEDGYKIISKLKIPWMSLWKLRRNGTD